MTTCTKNIAKSTFDKTFFVDKEKGEQVKIFTKHHFNVIDNPDIDLDASKKNTIGEGAYNIVKEIPLSKKCREKGKVAVRIRRLTGDEVYIVKNIDDIRLSDEIQKSIDNIIDLSEKKLHPDVYEIKVIRTQDKVSTRYYLIVVMEKYMSNLNEFIIMNKSKLKGPQGILEYQGGCPEDNLRQEIVVKGQKQTWVDYENGYKNKGYTQENHKIIIELIQKTEKLIGDIANQGYFCYDIKPANLVVNYDFDKQTIDIKMIDVDADFCVKDMHDNFGKTTPTYIKKHTLLDFSRYEIYKYVMMILLTGHLYKRQFNYFARYFTQLSLIFHDEYHKIMKNKGINDKTKTSHKVYENTIYFLFEFINKGGNIPDNDDVLEEICQHYFKKPVETMWKYSRVLPVIVGKNYMSFCLKNYYVERNGRRISTFNYEKLLKDANMRNNKSVEFIPGEPINEEEMMQIDADKMAQSKSVKSYKSVDEEIPSPIFKELKKKINDKRIGTNSKRTSTPKRTSSTKRTSTPKRTSSTKRTSTSKLSIPSVAESKGGSRKIKTHTKTKKQRKY